MGKKFVGLGGLKHFWTKAKTWIAGQITAEVTAKIAEIVANAPEDLDTLKEIADWIKTHANDASAMNTQINTNKNDIAALQTSVDGKSDTGHTHDDRYYTESEVDKKLAGKSNVEHTHTKSEITDFPTSLKNPNALTVNGKTYDGSSAVDAGVQTVANGGTGVTTQADINKAFIGNLDVGISDVTDGTEFVSSWASNNGFAETTDGSVNKPYKRKFSAVWSYIKSKISSVLGLTKDNYGGKAATAGTADRVNDGNNVVQYKATSFNGYKMQDIQEKALYVEGREFDSGDSGGIAITNDSVTVFGAGDTDGVFRVINEDNVPAGPVFKVMKDGQVYTTNTIHGSIDGTANTAYKIRIGNSNPSNGDIWIQ